MVRPAARSGVIIQLRNGLDFGFIPHSEATMKREQVTNLYSGHVQGIGFRYMVKNIVTGFEVAGLVRNLENGRVELVVEGEKEELEAFLQAIRDSELGRFIRQEQTNWSTAKNEFRGFEISH